jgi:hypothetical protein
VEVLHRAGSSKGPVALEGGIIDRFVSFLCCSQICLRYIVVNFFTVQGRKTYLRYLQ